MDNEMSEEMIQQQMEETRASLTEKIETLEQKVVGTVENATATVTETVEAIKETVHDTVATVQEGVKESVDTVKDLFDVPAHVQRRPWLMMGGSVAVGYCLGTVLAPSPRPRLAPGTNGAALQPRPDDFRASAAPTEPSIWAPEVAKLKGLTLGVLFGTARELLVSSLPPHLGAQVKEVVDSMTKKMGGEPLPSSDWARLWEVNPPAGEEGPEPQPAPNQQTKRETGNGHPAARRW